MRNRQMVRQLAILRALMDGAQRLDALAGDLAVTTRTIRRDIDALEEAHFAVVIYHDDDGATTYVLHSQRCPLCGRGPRLAVAA